MISYQTTTLSPPKSDEKVPNSTLSYFRSRNRHRLYSLVIKEFKKSGLSQAALARRLGKKPDIVCRWLSSPSNWQIDTISDLLFAISGAEADYSIKYPLHEAPRNDVRPAWLDSSPMMPPATDRVTKNTNTTTRSSAELVQA